jgi:hypothetical protein
MISYWLIMKIRKQISNILKISMMIVIIMIRMDIMVVMSMLIHLHRRLVVSNRKQLIKISKSPQKKMASKI